jgi:hypothetical protein
MEKENKFFLLFFIIIVCALVGALWWVKVRTNDISPASNSTTENDGVKLFEAPVEVPVLTDSAIRSDDQTKKAHIEFHFPVVLLAGRPELAKDANTVITAFASDTIRAFESDVSEMDSPLVPKDLESDLTVRYAPLLLSPTVISIRFDESEYIAGSAHPISRTRILNYDMERHLLLQTGDLFASSTQALPFLSDFTRAELHTILKGEAKGTYEEQALPGTEPTADNFSAVGITKEGLLVVFDQCQVSPCARGTIQIDIPLSQTEDKLAPRMKDAMRAAKENIVEAVPIESSSSTENGSN